MADTINSPYVTAVDHEILVPKDSTTPPKPFPVYQDIGELGNDRQTPANSEDRRVFNEHDSNSSQDLISDSVIVEPLPIYQEVRTLTSNETPPKSEQNLDRHESPEHSHSQSHGIAEEDLEIVSAPLTNHNVAPTTTFVDNSQSTITFRGASLPGYPQTHTYYLSSPPPLPSPTQQYFGSSSIRRPEWTVNELEEYKIPPGGTLV